ncbi:MAG: hypothetical protein RIC24_00550 [Hyphomicrobiales bacterium]|jgi:hypothetical protein
MRLTLAFLLTVSVMVVPALAQQADNLVNGDRYHIVELEDGVLRIDRQTGEISECNDTQNGWVCRLSADDRLAYEAEINRLDAEVDRLEEEVLAARQALENIGQNGEDDLSLLPDPGTVRERLDLPTDEELDAVMDTAEEVMRRFFGMVEGLREDLEAQRNQ